MNNSMIASAVSLGALQQKLDLLADNISNVNTVGYKRKTGIFEDILTSLQPHEPAFNLEGRRTPPGYVQGWGARLLGIQLDMSMGSLQPTGNATDIVIEGNGLFEVRTSLGPEGERAFTRHGAFQLMPTGDGDLMLVTNSGQAVIGTDGGVDDVIRIPAGYEMKVAADGQVTATSPDGSDVLDLGVIKVVQAVKPELLQSIGDNLYGVPADVDPDEVVRQVEPLPDGSTGVSVRQGFLEQSNVNLIDEMTDLTTVLRAYQLSARALTSSDQMMQMAANLRG